MPGWCRAATAISMARLTRRRHERRYGTVFKISTNGALTTLYSFTGDDGGISHAAWCRAATAISMARLIAAARPDDGTVFRISTNGTLTSLYSFTGGNDGANPGAGLVQGSDGNFYGTTVGGGTERLWHRVQNQHQWSADHFVSASPAALTYYPSRAGPRQRRQFYGTTGGIDMNNRSGTVFKISHQRGVDQFVFFHRRH